jgi:hypothetical protein
VKGVLHSEAVYCMRHTVMCVRDAQSQSAACVDRDRGGWPAGMDLQGVDVLFHYHVEDRIVAKDQL